MIPTTLIEQHLKELELFYDELDMGIILVDSSLKLFFINRWFLKKLPEELELLWERGCALNLKSIFSSDSTDKIEKVIKKAVKEKSITILSEAFHKWIIPLEDKRFADHKMRQTCIIQPYKKIKEIAVIQIKDESDTVLKNDNLRQSREQIKLRNSRLEQFNKELDIMNKELLLLNTELVNREKSVKQKSKMEAIGRMAGGIVHDFNNYLYIILGNTEYLMLDIPTTDSNYSCIQDIQNAVNSASDLIQEIAAFRRLDMHTSDIGDESKTNLNVYSTMKAQISLVKAMIPKSILFTYCYGNLESHYIYATSSQIQRILFNLVINAVHAVSDNYFNELDSNNVNQTLSSKGNSNEIKGHINILVQPVVINKISDLDFLYKTALPKETEMLFFKSENIINYDNFALGKYIAVSIYDSGHGISSDNLEKIFDPYFTTKPAGKGSGIGLSVVLGIVKNLNGAVHVKSELNKGTVFTVVIPDAG